MNETQKNLFSTLVVVCVQPYQKGATFNDIKEVVGAFLALKALSNPSVEIDTENTIASVCHLLGLSRPSTQETVTTGKRILKEAFGGKYPRMALEDEDPVPGVFAKCGTSFFKIQIDDFYHHAEGKAAVEAARGYIIDTARSEPKSTPLAEMVVRLSTSLPQHVNKEAYLAAFCSISEFYGRSTTIPETEIMLIHQDLLLYSSKLKEYGGLGADGLLSAHHAVMRQSGVVDRRIAKALKVYLQVATS